MINEFSKVNNEIPAPRRLSMELLSFIASGQPGVERARKIGHRNELGGIFQDIEDEAEVLVELADLVGLAHATCTPHNQLAFFNAVGYPASLTTSSIFAPFSLELANLLPAGHPFRCAQGIKDDPDAVLAWIFSGNQLSSRFKEVAKAAIDSTDYELRATLWPEFLDLLDQEAAKWPLLFETVSYYLKMHYMGPLEEMHPREHAVLLLVGGGMDFESVATRFAVESSRIIEIFAVSIEKLRQSFPAQVQQMQLLVDKRETVLISNLAGLMREPRTADGEFPITNLLAGLCSLKRLSRGDLGVLFMSNASYQAIQST